MTIRLKLLTAEILTSHENLDSLSFSISASSPLNAPLSINTVLPVHQKKQYFGHITEIFVDASKFTQLPMFCSSRFNFPMTKPIKCGAKVSKRQETIIGHFE